MSWQAHVEFAPMTDRYRCWIFQPRHDATGTDFLDPDLTTITTVAAGETTPEPTMEFRREIAEALAQGIAFLGGPADATRAHLQDAVKVRDRLLAIVERP